jgi:hypothetical protein
MWDWVFWIFIAALLLGFVWLSVWIGNHDKPQRQGRASIFWRGGHFGDKSQR